MRYYNFINAGLKHVETVFRDFLKILGEYFALLRILEKLSYQSV